MANNAKYNALDRHLHHVLKTTVNIDEELRRQMSINLHTLLKKLITRMKRQNSIFRSLYQKVIYVGSYYENLRIKEPDEFDLNLELHLPVDKLHVQIEQSRKAGFGRIKILPFNSRTRSNEYILKWVDEHGFLLRERLLQWVQSVVDKALHSFDVPGCEVAGRSRSGPAITLTVRNNLINKEYSVDLVPVISFSGDVWPAPPVRQPEEEMCDTWFMVPKAPMGYKNRHLWRMSFTLQEKAIIHHQQAMKPVIRLMKLLRDVQKWKSLSSYFVKTVFLWENQHRKDPQLWQKGLGQVFMHMLKTMQKQLNRKSIPFYWDERFDLTNTMTVKEKQENYGCKRPIKIRLRTIISINMD
ncbi:cyclic GMP-AMP synthase-like receptor isoform X2 [Anabrus simplex]|uniref:cyclic GMP-AMP synthase-like receptor isoform X2 n=1 Tax=Anabrus simplex TaxID=316456 RepID=UPI0035A333D5